MGNAFALKFADGSDQYTFTNVTRFSPQFASLKNQLANLPGLHGAFDPQYTEEGLSDVGSLTVEFELLAATANELQAQLDAVNRLASLGRQTFYYQPQGEFAARRCSARIKSIPLDLRAEDALLIQTMRCELAVPDPFWRHAEESSATAITALTDVTITNTGNAVALARIVITCAVGQTYEAPTVRRIVSAATADEMAYAADLAAGDTLILNAQAKSVLHNGVGAYASLSFMHADWMRLLPGANTIRASSSAGGSAGTMTVYWSDTFR